MHHLDNSPQSSNFVTTTSNSTKSTFANFASIINPCFSTSKLCTSTLLCNSMSTHNTVSVGFVHKSITMTMSNWISTTGKTTSFVMCASQSAEECAKCPARPITYQNLKYSVMWKNLEPITRRITMSAISKSVKCSFSRMVYNCPSIIWSRIRSKGKRNWNLGFKVTQMKNNTKCRNKEFSYKSNNKH